MWADRLTNPATDGCRKGDGNAPPERLLDGVRVGEEDLLKHFGTTAPPRRVVFELERLQPPVLAEGLGQAEEPHLTRDVGGLEQGRLPHRD